MIQPRPDGYKTPFARRLPAVSAPIMTEIGRADNIPVIICPGMRHKRDYARPKSVDRFYALRPIMWKTPQNPVFRGILPPKPVDNHVESVDFCMNHALYIRWAVCSFNLKFVTKSGVMKNVCSNGHAPEINI